MEATISDAGGWYGVQSTPRFVDDWHDVSNRSHASSSGDYDITRTSGFLFFFPGIYYIFHVR